MIIDMFRVLIYIRRDLVIGFQIVYYGATDMPPRRRAPNAAAASIAAPIPTPIIAAPIAAAAAPILATASITPIAIAAFTNPRRDRQLPRRYRDGAEASAAPNRIVPAGEEGESFDLEDVSGDEEEDNSVPTVRAPTGPSPLQTAINTVAPTGPSPLQTPINTVHSTPTEPLATSGRAKKPKSSDDVLFFFREDKVAKRRICIPCEYVLCLHQRKTFFFLHSLPGK
jgi:hypothetical protein